MVGFDFEFAGRLLIHNGTSSVNGVQRGALTDECPQLDPHGRNG
jgi:hypothetical protein